MCLKDEYSTQSIEQVNGLPMQTNDKLRFDDSRLENSIG